MPTLKIVNSMWPDCIEEGKMYAGEGEFISFKQNASRAGTLKVM